MSSDEIKRVADYCRTHVDLSNLPTDYSYPSLTLCIINAVYSIGVRYEGVVNVIARYCAHCGVSADWPDHQRPSARAFQQPVSDLLARMKQHGTETFTLNVFQNQQRTSTRSGILKGEAVYQFAQALEKHRIEYVQDLPETIIGSSRFPHSRPEFGHLTSLFPDACRFGRLHQTRPHDPEFSCGHFEAIHFFVGSTGNSHGCLRRVEAEFLAADAAPSRQPNMDVSARLRRMTAKKGRDKPCPCHLRTCRSA